MKNVIGLMSLVASCMLGGCVASAHMDTKTRAEAQQSLQAYASDMMDHVGRGDFSGVKASACPDAVIYDIGDNGAPVVARGRAEVDALLDKFAQMMTAPGVSSAMTVSRLDCRVDAGPGFCLIELQQTVTANGQTMGPMKFRATMITKKHKGQWIWTHWHSSAAEMPAPPPPPPPPVVEPVPAPEPVVEPAPAPPPPVKAAKPPKAAKPAAPAAAPAAPAP